MYQLSHTLTEQKSLMTSMMEMSLVSDKAIVEEAKEPEQEVNLEEETRRNLAFLLEKVEGCSVSFCLWSEQHQLISGWAFVSCLKGSGFSFYSS